MSKSKEERLKKNGEYWKKRFEALEESQYKKSIKYYQDIEKQFRMATNSVQVDIEKWYRRLADNNDISYSGARKLLKKNELEEFHWSLEEYIQKGQENAVNQQWMRELENASAKVHINRLEAMKIQMQQHAELLSTQYQNKTTEFLRNTYADNFYKTAFEVQKGVGVGINLTKLDTRRIDQIITQPWASDGANFSDRIWSNKDKLVRNLHTELTQSIIRGENPNKAGERLARIMNVSKGQASRLVMTESAAISSNAQKDCLNELGVEKYEILATLDNRTSDICQDMDGKIFDMKNYQVGLTAPPFHPYCRSTTVPYFDDEFTEDEVRAARDENGKTYYVPGDMNYKEWKEVFVRSDKQEQEKASRKDNINTVAWSYVKSKEYKEKFNQISNNKKVNETIYKKSIDMLEHRNNTDYEDMYLIDSVTGKVVATQTHSNAILGVVYNDEIKQVLRKSEANTLISIHNHPRNTPPSGGDFVSSARNGYKQGIIVCHNGDIYLYKTGKKPFTSGLFDRKVIEYKGTPYYLNEKDAYIKVLNQFEEEYGIQWKEIK